MNYCVFCGFRLDKLKCTNCGARFKVKIISTEEDALVQTKVIRIIGKKRQPLHKVMRRYRGDPAYASSFN